MSKTANVPEMVKHIPKCDFVSGNSNWESQVKTALAGSQVLYCIEQDIVEDFLDRHIVAEKLKSRSMWNALQKLYNLVEGEFKDFWELELTYTDEPIAFMCKSRWEMKPEQVAKLQSEFTLASEIIWHTLSAQLQEKVGDDWYEKNKAFPRELWNKIKEELKDPDAWSKIMNKQSLREIQIQPGESTDNYLIRAKEILKDGLAAGTTTAKEAPWEILGGLVGEEWNDLISNFRGMKEEEVTMSKITSMLSAPRKRKNVDGVTKINYGGHDDEAEDDVPVRPIKKPKLRPTTGVAVIKCTFCSRPKHLAEDCWINPESDSFKADHVKKWLEMKPTSKRAKAIQNLLKSPKYQEAVRIRVNYGSFAFRGDDSDDEGLPIEECGLYSFA
jgi:hypothetical protein